MVQVKVSLFVNGRFVFIVVPGGEMLVRGRGHIIDFAGIVGYENVEIECPGVVIVRGKPHSVAFAVVEAAIVKISVLAA